MGLRAVGLLSGGQDRTSWSLSLQLDENLLRNVTVEMMYWRFHARW
jgi:hypothetical protein